MKTILREFNEIEQEIIDLQLLVCQKKLVEKFNWSRTLLVIALLGLTFFLIWKYDFGWVTGLMLFVFTYTLYAHVKSYFEEKRSYRALQSKLSILKDKKAVKVVECWPTRALYLPSYQEEGDHYLLEIGKNKLLCYHQSYEVTDLLIPNDHLRFYADSEVITVMGNGVEMLGDRIAPITIPGDVKIAIYDDWSFPEHLEIIEMSIEEFLEKAKKRIFQQTLAGATSK